MPSQNGTSNTVENSGRSFDDVSGGSPHMAAANEASPPDGDSPVTASSSLMDSEDVGGRDNPAFETDDPGGSPGGGKKNGEVSRGQPANAVVSSNGRDVEMVPLNPSLATAAPQHQTNNGNGTANNKDQKVALDTMYSDYFRPVNTRRKLLRGEKLYVTRDQRAHSRGWKWIAFWGGVFTFVAAALLTGILAATGIIMSKGEPSFGSSHSTLVGNGNHSSENDTDFHDSNFYPKLDPDGVTIAAAAEHPISATSNTESTHIPSQGDFGNSLDDNSWTTKTSGHRQSDHPTDHIIYWLNHLNITGNDLGVETTTTSTTSTTTERTLGADVASSVPEPSENVNGAIVPLDNVTNAINDRGRSLNEDVTIVPMDDETTLFPTLKSIDEVEGDDGPEDVVPSVDAANETDTSTTTSFVDGPEFPFWNLTSNVSLTNGTLDSGVEEPSDSSTDANLLLDQMNSTAIEHKERPANETVEGTANSTSIDGRNAGSSQDNNTLDDVITQEVNTTDVSSNETTVVSTLSEVTTTVTTTMFVHDTTWTQSSNMSLTPSDAERSEGVTIPQNVSVNVTSDFDFALAVNASDANDTSAAVTDMPDNEEELLDGNSTLVSLNSTDELSLTTAVDTANATDVTTAATATTTTVVSEAMNATTQYELLSNETMSSVETTPERLWTSEVESSNVTDNSASMSTENSTTSLAEEEEESEASNFADLL